MAPKFNNNSSISILCFIFIMVVLLPRSVTAQSPVPTSNSTSQYGYFSSSNLTSSMLIIVILVITLFFLFGFVSVYLRQCAGEQILGVGPGIQPGTMNRQPRGLDPAIIAKFPIMVYSEVKEHKIGKRALECAVCLSEFEDDEKLRLLPKCSHVFHPDCIDAWLSGHVTCPVCRSNLTDYKIGDMHTQNPDATTEYDASMLETTIVTDQRTEDTSVGPMALPADALVLEVKPETEEDQFKREEATELERIRTFRRAVKSKSNWRPPRLFPSHSTGHSLSSLPQTIENPDCYTLKPPDPVLRQIIAEGKLTRSTSALALKETGEESSRGGRSIRMFVSDLSERVSAWGVGIGRRVDVEWSVRGEGSTVRGRLESVKVEPVG